MAMGAHTHRGWRADGHISGLTKSSATSSSAGVIESGWSRRESHWHWWMPVMPAPTNLVEDKQTVVCQQNRTLTSGDDIHKKRWERCIGKSILMLLSDLSLWESCPN